MNYGDFSNPPGGYNPGTSKSGGYDTLTPPDKTSVASPTVPVSTPSVIDISGFLPSQNGLKYRNSWPDVPYFSIPTPFGNIPVGDASNGMCGGMVYAVRDLFEANRLPPADTTNPAPNSRAFNFLYARLLQSFDLPVGVATYYAWMNLPRNDAPNGIRGTSWKTIMETMPKLRKTINDGHLCPLGLVCVQSANPFDLGLNHQVLAWEYSDNGPKTTVKLYDPNIPNNDSVTITFDNSKPDQTTDFIHSERDEPIFGFFTTNYSPENPSPLFDPK